MFSICLKINRKWLTAIQAVCAEMSWSSLGRNSIVFDSSLSTAPERRMWKVKNQQFKLILIFRKIWQIILRILGSRGKAFWSKQLSERWKVEAKQIRKSQKVKIRKNIPEHFDLGACWCSSQAGDTGPVRAASAAWQTFHLKIKLQEIRLLPKAGYFTPHS